MKSITNLFNKENKKVATAKELEAARHKGYGEGALAMAVAAVAVGLAEKAISCGVKNAVKIVTRRKSGNDSDDAEVEDFSAENPNKEEDVDRDKDDSVPEDKAPTATVQEEASSEPIKEEESNNDSNDSVDTDGCDDKTEEKEDVKVEKTEKEIDDDIRDIMNTIEQMPRRKRKEISDQITNGTFVVPDGINISADTLKRLSVFMMNSAISEEEVLEKSEDTKSDETDEDVNTEEKTA